MNERAEDSVGRPLETAAKNSPLSPHMADCTSYSTENSRGILSVTSSCESVKLIENKWLGKTVIFDLQSFYCHFSTF